MQTHGEYTGRVARSLRNRLPSAVIHRLPEGVIPLAALHDIGKISPGFILKYFPDLVREKCTDIATHSIEAYRTNHAEVSEAALMEWLRRTGLGAEPWSVPLGMHHGRRTLPHHASAGIYGGPLWQKERERLIEHMLEEFGDLPTAPPGSDAERDAVAGFLCVCDWIASDERFFPVIDTSGDTCTLDRVEEVLNQCGWVFGRVTPGLSFHDLFDFEPNAIQADFINEITEPGLYILEAPMGYGKTEAALYGAYSLISRGVNSGIYFALPTRVTSERIHQRVEQFLSRIMEGTSHSVRLVHGQSWLVESGGELEAGRAWFHPRKRALLTPYGVGTIDQALLGVLRVKHSFLRLFGLTGKVVILDELHSYDLYTGSLCDLLIQSLLNLGCTVIILSATLTSRRKQTIFPENTLLASAYPLVTRQVPGKPIAQHPIPLPPAACHVRICFSSEPAENTAELAVTRAGSGECVLWVCNSVASAQECFRMVRSTMRTDAFPVGLLHSRFPGFRRMELENRWLEALGKDGAYLDPL